MQFKFGFLFFICLTSSINQIIADICSHAETAKVCLGNKTAEIQISANEFACQVNTISRPKVRDDYTYTPGVGYHKFHAQAKQWNQARKICRDEGGHLAVIDSKEEHQVLVDVFKREEKNIKDAYMPNLAWLGAHNLYDNNDWVTEFGESLTDVMWAPGEPNNVEGNEHCLTLIGTGNQGTNDAVCAKPYAFFCEIPDTCS